MTDSSRRERMVRVAVGSSALVVGLNLNTVSIAFADMRAHAFKGESLAALGWVLSIYTIFFGALLVPAGRLADFCGFLRNSGTRSPTTSWISWITASLRRADAW